MRPWAPLLPVLLLAGCAQPAQGGGLEVGGPFGARPTVVFPDGEPATALQVDEPTTGKGARLGRDSVAVVQFTAHVWDGAENRVVDSTFDRGAPAALRLGSLPKGLDAALRGRRAGSRVVVALPPGDGFGPNPPQGVGPGDELLYVVDILAAYGRGAAAGHARGGTLEGVTVSPGAPPRVVIPAGPAPARFAAKIVTKGDGPKTRAGQLLVTQHVGLLWRGGRVVEGSWSDGWPRAVRLGDGSVVKGWERALTGVPVGSRVAFVVPPALGHGRTGVPALGIRGSDTLVFVVDVLGAH
ncbi:FKBP-type peptidyl-prolyl cis-trans isomerase [Nonomuraea sp. NPDC050663]|uniref:FKBP-type peptidyl-prolyl cis-trans isomerase n=1 Tax=Nonomuraea sp. NPDC050663 TaxID=3364370 RepID=UPI0037BB005A